MLIVNLQPLINQSGNFQSLPDALGKLTPTIIALAGIILLVLIIFSGFTILTGANNPDQVKKGKDMLTAALAGFFLIFAAYWLAQALEVFFAFPIVNP